MVYKLLFILWLIFTLASGLYEHRYGALPLSASHPLWASISALVLLYLFLKKSKEANRWGQKSKTELTLLISLAILTGLAAKMNFLPFSLHQFATVSLAVFGVYILLR